MNSYLLLISFSLFFPVIVSAQITSYPADGRMLKTDQVVSAEARLNQITSDAGRFFKQGLLSLQESRCSDAADQFNKAVEVFLMSGINLTSKDNARSRDCYNQMIETIYRIEFPTDAQIPQIRSLSATCLWNIDNQLADDIAKLVRPSLNKPEASAKLFSAANTNETTAENPLLGFNEQKFESSRFDDLAVFNIEEENKKSRQTKEIQLLTWNDIAKRTGVSVEALKAVNPGKIIPSGKIFVPLIKTINVNNPIIKIVDKPKPPTIKIIRAMIGDTVETLAKRHGADPVEVAKFNGLLPSSMLSGGRQIKLPLKGVENKSQPSKTKASAAKTDTSSKTPLTDINVVKAQAGDTVAKLAGRYGVNAVEVAKFNGVLPSTVLGAGREIKIPIKGSVNRTSTQITSSETPTKSTISTNSLAGTKPVTDKDGKVEAVLEYFNENLHDPYSIRFVRWSPLQIDFYNYRSCWSVKVKFRAKNPLGAYVLTEAVYFIYGNKVIGVKELRD